MTWVKIFTFNIKITLTTIDSHAYHYRVSSIQSKIKLLDHQHQESPKQQVRDFEKSMQLEMAVKVSERVGLGLC